MKAISFFARILKFNPTELMSRSLRRCRLLKNPDVMEMLRMMHTYGESSQRDRAIKPSQDDY